MTNPVHSTVVLRALEGAPLRDGAIRSIVVATAHAIAERNGVEIVRLEVGDDRVCATLNVHRLAALGFAAELRRLTTNWHRSRHGETAHLWGEPRTEPEEDDPADWWKRG